MNNITSAPNIINCGNPSSTNLKVRNRMKDNKETTSEIFAKLNKRGKLDPRQNAMNYQLTNDQLFRFYVQDVEPKLEKSNETNGENPNDLLKKEIQRLINVGDTKNDVMTKLLQGKFSDLTQSVNTAGTTPPSAAAIAAAIAGVLPAPVAGPSASDIASAIAGALAAAGIGSAPVSGTGPPVTGPPVTSGGGGGGGPPATSGGPPATSGGPAVSSGGAGTGPPAASGVSGGTSGVSVPSTGGGSTVAFAPSVTIAPSITSTAALASSAAAASTAGSGLLVMTPGTSAAASALLSLGTSTTTNISLPIKGGTGQEYSLPVSTYLKINAAGNWGTKRNEWPSLGDHLGSRQAWDRIIPNLDNSDFQLRLDKMNEFLLIYPKPKDFLDAYKSANAGFSTGSVSSPSPAPSGGAAGGAASASLSPSPNSSSVLAALGLASASSSPAATGTALFPPLLTKAQRWAGKARSAGADAAAYTAATGVNTVLFSDGSFGSSSRFGS